MTHVLAVAVRSTRSAVAQTNNKRDARQEN